MMRSISRRYIAIGGAVVFAAGYIVAYSIHDEKQRDRLPEGSPSAAPAGDEWIALFEPPYADQWVNPDDDVEVFELQEGALHILGASRWTLRYAAMPDLILRDFKLHLEYKIAPGGNSGLFLRCPEDGRHRGFEIQIVDDHGREPRVNGTGAIYDVVVPMYNVSRPAGEWNSLDVVVQGQRVEVVVNGWKVIDTDLSQLRMPVGKFDVPFAEYAREGYIALQDHGAETWFREFYVLRLDSASDSTGTAERRSAEIDDV